METAAPTSSTVPPKVFSSGSERAKVAASPPTITASVPALAPAGPPETGASRNSTPAAASRAACSRAAAGRPLVQSIQTVPGRSVGNSRSM